MKKDCAIAAINLSKVFTLRYKNSEGGNELVALNDVSFSIKKGEQVGIFGLNGSGKSTLLKILSGITKPSYGSVEISGKVASILDIGAGFHPELSGYDNVFLNGQLLGFSREDIESKYDEIIAFSGIEKFINEPVKYYSNGMYLRLAFSIYAHLDFDIYLFDEVLHVGDTGFIFKTHQKIQELSESNKTIILASHNINDLQNCDTLIELNSGSIKNISSQKDILSKYINFSIKENKVDVLNKATKIIEFNSNKPNSKVNLLSISIYQELNCSDSFISQKSFFIDVEYEKLSNNDTLDIIITISDSNGYIILVTTPFITGLISEETDKGFYSAKCEITANFFSSNTYCLGITFVKNVKSLQHVDLKHSNDLLSVFENFGVVASYNKICYFIFEVSISNFNDLGKLKLPAGYLLPGFNWNYSKNIFINNIKNEVE